MTPIIIKSEYLSASYDILAKFLFSKFELITTDFEIPKFKIMDKDRRM